MRRVELTDGDFGAIREELVQLKNSWLTPSVKAAHGREVAGREARRLHGLIELMDAAETF
jgi:hypothetical protein